MENILIDEYHSLKGKRLKLVAPDKSKRLKLDAHDKSDSNSSQKLIVLSVDMNPIDPQCHADVRVILNVQPVLIYFSRPLVNRLGKERILVL